MDWMLFWTAITAIAGMLAILGGIFSYLRKGDLAYIKALKQDTDNKIDNMTSTMNDLYTNMQAKLDKQEHQQSLLRIDKEMDQLRRDQKDDFNRIENKIDRLIDMIMEFRK